MEHMVTCCFTGHRPEKLNVPEEIVIKELKKAVKEAFSNGVTAYITGMSRGIDIWGAEIVLELKKEHPLIIILLRPISRNRLDSLNLKVPDQAIVLGDAYSYVDHDKQLICIIQGTQAARKKKEETETPRKKARK